MKTLTVILGLFYVLSAQAQYGISRTETVDLICTLFRSAGRLENGLLLFPCASPKGNYGIGFAGIEMNLPAAAKQGSSLHLRFHCTVAKPQGAYIFGGETIGFETSSNPRQKFFYAAGEGNFGRCYISGDKALMANLKMKVNQSALAILPAAKAPKPEVAR